MAIGDKQDDSNVAGEELLPQGDQLYPCWCGDRFLSLSLRQRHIWECGGFDMHWDLWHLGD